MATVDQAMREALLQQEQVPVSESSKTASGNKQTYYTLDPGTYMFRVVGNKLNVVEKTRTTGEGKIIAQEGDFYYNLRCAPCDEEGEAYKSAAVFLQLSVPIINPNVEGHQPNEPGRMIWSAEKFLAAADPTQFTKNVYDHNKKLYRNAEGELLSDSETREYGRTWKENIRDVLTRVWMADNDAPVGFEFFGAVRHNVSNNRTFVNWDYKVGFSPVDQEPAVVTYDIKSATTEA